MIGRCLISAAVVASTTIAATAWFKVKSPRDTIRVTGSATQRIVSDLIEWDSTIRHTASTRAEAYRVVRKDVDATVAYLEDKGIAAEDIRVSSASVNAYFDVEYEQVGNEAVSHSRLAGFEARQTVTVTSHQVELVERVSREVSALLDQNIPIESSAPRYHYTGLEDLKIEMLAAAADDARLRADEILAAAGDAERGDLVATQMGVININPANSTATSWDGQNDKTSLHKDIMTIVHVVYEVD
ncbi:SIMPL domain-containing protein [Enhygromyxa salina]|uniref:SIMPL domain-containing protein n=1 Tax=Enhygromyxa salina TaxID=215803 RepID=UPI0015E6534F|nr:SIMPL domain-containing protein [Enhygromyxa salina]